MVVSFLNELLAGFHLVDVNTKKESTYAPQITKLNYDLYAPQLDYQYAPTLVIGSSNVSTATKKEASMTSAPYLQFIPVSIPSPEITSQAQSKESLGESIKDVAILGVLGFIGYKVVDKMIR